MAEETGGIEKRFFESFGNVVHWNGPLGVRRALCQRHLAFKLTTELIDVCIQEDCLWIADPKAINHILQKSGYLYAKPGNMQEMIALVADRGVGWAEGESSTTITPFFELIQQSHR